MIHGHEVTLKALREGDLPPVTLLMGPASTGKFLVGETVLHDRGYRGATLVSERSPSIETTRHIKDIAVQRGYQRAILMDIDSLSVRASNGLLKILEEPPPHIHVILVASKPPLMTIVSRSFTFRTGLLSDKQLQDVLTSRYGLGLDVAARAARAGRGQVRPALAFIEVEQAKTPVLTLVRSVAQRDAATFFATASTWSHESHQLLGTWARELATGQYCVFSPNETYGMNKLPLRELQLLLTTITGPLRPRLSVKAAFMDMVNG